MNDELQAFARAQILDGLSQLPDRCVMLFKRMYAHRDLDKPLANVVRDIPAEKLDWAMQQVSNTLAKHAKGLIKP